MTPLRARSDAALSAFGAATVALSVGGGELAAPSGGGGESIAAPAVPGVHGSWQSGLRYERKFRPGRDPQRDELRLLRHPWLFRRLFHPRDVFNLYYDHPDRRLLRAGVDGISDRRKVRIRWYDGDLGRPTLEVKGRSGQLGWKVSHPLEPLTAADLQRPLPELLDGAPPALIEALRGLQPTLSNRYHRTYWLSANGAFRACVDSQLRFARPGGPMALDPLARQTVLELKYTADAEAQEAAVITALGLRVSRFSKYGAGCALLGLA